MLSRRLHDLSRVDNATARRLLASYGAFVRRAVTLYQLDPDEGFAVGTDALLEAYLTLDTSKAKETTWVRRVVHWRLQEALNAVPWDRTAESLDADPQVINGSGPEEAYMRTSLVAALVHLPLRQQMLIDGRMREETYVEVGASIGISRGLAHRESARALRTLRAVIDGERERGVQKLHAKPLKILASASVEDRSARKPTANTLKTEELSSTDSKCLRSDA